MLHASNIQDLLVQTAKPISTTSKSILGIAITLPTGSLLSSYIPQITTISETSSLEETSTQIPELSITKLKMYALYVQKELQEQPDLELLKFEVEGLELYVQGVPNTEFSVIVITESGYPDGLIKLKIDQLNGTLKELENFQYDG